MALWTFYDYVETTGRHPIREWLDSLPQADCAKIDYRLRQMAILPRWSDKWVSKYRGADDLYEFRISGNNVEYRPLGTYFGEKRYILLAGAIEKGDKIPRSDIETAERRLANARKDWAHVTFHQYDGEDLEENGD
jgi:phage-related protein